MKHAKNFMILSFIMLLNSPYVVSSHAKRTEKRVKTQCSVQKIDERIARAKTHGTMSQAKFDLLWSYRQLLEEREKKELAGYEKITIQAKRDAHIKSRFMRALVGPTTELKWNVLKAQYPMQYGEYAITRVEE